MAGRQRVPFNAWIEVNLKVFEKNLRGVQSALCNETKLCAMLKSNAYGVGIEALMPSVLQAKIDCIGVSSNEEIRIARASGFNGRLMRMRTATPAEIEEVWPHQVEELVGNADVAREIGNISRDRGREVRVHLDLNSTGLCRNGLELRTDRGKADVQALLRIEGLHVVGVMTHFPVKEKSEVHRGLIEFNDDCNWLFANTSLKRSQVLLHAASSFATLNVPESHLDLVRCGSALYGYSAPRPAFGHVIAFKSTVASVNAYPAGSTVGYDRSAKLERDSLLANIPVGWSDGYGRAFSNKGTVLLHEQRAPVVGKVSMNTLMVDVSDIPGVQIGDEVVLFGKQGTAEITRAEIEQITGLPFGDHYTMWGAANPKVVCS